MEYASEDVGAIEGSPLERVIGAGLGRHTNGVTVELIALEIRSLGMIAYLRAELRNSLVGPTPFDPLTLKSRVLDDDGTRYSIVTSVAESSTRGPGASIRVRAWAAISPAPPRRARRLTFIVERIEAERAVAAWTNEGRVEGTEVGSIVPGPWEFRLPIA